MKNDSINSIIGPADKEKYPSFSAMLCLYINNDPVEVFEALNSALVEQTCPPDELVVIFDGPVPDDVAQVIEDFSALVDIKHIKLEKNMGHGVARATAIKNSSHDWMAIIDSDDISAKDRFELLLNTITLYPESAVVGGGYTEFTDHKSRTTQGKCLMLPENPSDVVKYIQKRSPVAQATAILRIEAVMAVGNYQHWFNNEDYYLWIRLVSNGYNIRNVQKSLLLVRTTPGFYTRRGGFRYWKNEIRLQAYSLSCGTTTLFQFLLGGLIRFIVQVLMPSSLRTAFYNHFLRQ